MFSPEKLTVDEFKTYLTICACSTIKNIVKINDKLIHVTSEWILGQIKEENYSNLVYLSMSTFYMQGNDPTPFYGISGRWTYAYHDGYFIRIAREGRCS